MKICTTPRKKEEIVKEIREYLLKHGKYKSKAMYDDARRYREELKDIVFKYTPKGEKKDEKVEIEKGESKEKEE